MRIRLALLLLLVTHAVGAQGPDSSGTIVSGTVRDSIAHQPLVDAIVQLVATDGSGHGARTTNSDSLGHYSFSGVPSGRYAIGFLHPMLDSLGLEPPVREVLVNGAPVLAYLAIPSAVQLRTSICGAVHASDSSGVVVGVVRDAGDDAPMADVAVSAAWVEYTFTSGGVERRTPRLVATTGDNGWFAICNVPAGGMMTIQASRGADSTDLLAIEVPPDGFLRRGLYLGIARDGRLHGTVTAAKGEQPLAGAQVGVVNGPQTRSNERGEWALDGLSAGTRLLEVRAVGYYPLQRPVNVVPGAPSLHLSLSTLKAVLDTIRVTARVYDPASNGFNERRRTGMGHYFSGKEVVARSSIFTSSVFRTVQGLRMERDTATGDTHLVQRGAFGWCQPAVYLNGHYIAGATADDIDSWVLPKDVTGIEVYDESMVPPQFQRALTGCGAIVIWSK